MRLLSLREFEFEPGDFFCRERRIGRAIALIAFAVCAVIFFLVGEHIDQTRKPAWLVSLCCVVCVLTKAPGVWRGWRTNPWVVCVRQSGIALNLRSCRNADRSPDDRVVAWLDWKEIRFAGESRTELRMPDPDNWRDHRHREQYLALELAHTRTEELESALRHEFAEGESFRVHYFAPTLMLRSKSRIRVCWEDDLRTLRPRLSEVLLALTPHVPIGESERESIDWTELGADEIEALLRERFRGGHHDQVIRLLRKQRKLSRQDAEKYVEELATSASDA